MDFAISRQPVIAHLQDQQRLPTDQSQDIAQVITVQRGQRATAAFAESIHQQRGVRCYRIAVHQPQFALVVVTGVHEFLVVAKQ